MAQQDYSVDWVRPPKVPTKPLKPENMLYSEFIERVGRVRTAEEYHAQVEPEYYDFPGNKDEFCLKFIVDEINHANDEFWKSRDYLEKAFVKGDKDEIDMWTDSYKMWAEIWRELMERHQALVKRMY